MSRIAKLNIAAIIGTSLLCSAAISAVPPSNDIILLSVDTDSITPNSSYTLNNITMREGYDNQPHFSDDGTVVYFTRAFNVADNKSQTDLMSYDLKTSKIANVTNTPRLSEYSATPYGEGYVSAIGQTVAGKQYLNKIALDGSSNAPFHTSLEPIGYHAWLNSEQAAVFVLGDVMTMQMYNTNPKLRSGVLAENIGRSFHSVQTGKVSFTIEVDGHHQVMLVTNQMALENTGITLPKGIQDYAWLDAQTVIYGVNDKLMMQNKAEQTLLFDFSSSEQTIKNISRLAISKDKKQLAIVYER